MEISHGKSVSISYLIKNGSGSIVECSDVPITFVHGGQHELFPQIEEALTGKSVGDQVEVKLEPEEAFGVHDPGLVFTDLIENAPPEVRRLGAELDAESASGKVLHFRVTEIKDGKITIDANHLLAGQTILFNVTVEEVKTI